MVSQLPKASTTCSGSDGAGRRARFDHVSAARAAFTSTRRISTTSSVRKRIIDQMASAEPCGPERVWEPTPTVVLNVEIGHEQAHGMRFRLAEIDRNRRVAVNGRPDSLRTGAQSTSGLAHGRAACNSRFR